MPLGTNAGPYRSVKTCGDGLGNYAYPVPAKVRLGLTDPLTNACIFELPQGHYEKHIKRFATYITSRGNLGVRTRGDVEPIVPGRLERNSDVRVVVDRRQHEVGDVEDTLPELIVHPSDRISCHSLVKAVN